jgi:hypothetical protein
LDALKRTPLGRWVVGLLALLVVNVLLGGCDLQPRPFANGTTRAVGPFEVALTVDPNPPRVGRETVLTFELRRDGRPVQPGEVTCELLLDMPKMPMNLPAQPVTFMAAGQARAQYVFPMAGEWTAALRVALPDGSSGTARFDFDVGP